MHIMFSLDAYIGDNRQPPDMAYRFSKGEGFDLHGEHQQLKRPLDFAAVTDHSKYIGEMYSTIVPDAPGHDNADLVKLRSLTSLEEKQQLFLGMFSPSTVVPRSLPIQVSLPGPRQSKALGRS